MWFEKMPIREISVQITLSIVQGHNSRDAKDAMVRHLFLKNQFGCQWNQTVRNIK